MPRVLAADRGEGQIDDEKVQAGHEQPADEHQHDGDDLSAVEGGDLGSSGKSTARLQSVRFSDPL